MKELKSKPTFERLMDEVNSNMDFHRNDLVEDPEQRVATVQDRQRGDYFQDTRKNERVAT